MKIGDKVRVRQWDDMVNEFGLNCDDDIKVINELSFVEEMKECCGQILTISRINENDTYVSYDCFENSWEWVDGMFEKEYQPKHAKETVNHPEHYNQGKYECIDEMIELFGVEAVIGFCKCNIYKYKTRASHKNGDEDMRKADWYMDKLLELQGEME